jgi:hypothetical protein
MGLGVYPDRKEELLVSRSSSPADHLSARLKSIPTAEMHYLRPSELAFKGSAQQQKKADVHTKWRKLNILTSNLRTYQTCRRPGDAMQWKFESQIPTIINMH